LFSSRSVGAADLLHSRIEVVVKIFAEAPMREEAGARELEAETELAGAGEEVAAEAVRARENLPPFQRAAAV
jgi:hypothetical protein